MAVDKKKLLAELKKAKERMGKIRFLKKNTTHHLRILEFKDEDGSRLFSRRVSEHKRVDADFKTKGNLCRSETLGELCAYCQINKVAVDEGESQPFKYRNYYLVNAIDIDAADKKVAIWQVPNSSFQDIANTLMDDDYADVLEASVGHAFTIKREGEGLETKYHTVPMRKPWPVSKELLAQVKDPLEVVDDPGLQGQLDELGMEKTDLFEDADLEEYEDKEEVSEPEGEDEEEASEESSEEPEGDDEAESSEEAEDEEKESTQPLCFGKEKLFDEDSECSTDPCPFYDACKKIVMKKLGTGKKTTEDKKTTKAEAPKKTRGRPKGSKKKVATKGKKSAKELASRITGR